jgi:hypothetical protein
MNESVRRIAGRARSRLLRADEADMPNRNPVRIKVNSHNSTLADGT